MSPIHWPLADEAVGLPHNAAVLPLYGDGNMLEMSFIERVQNLWKYLLVDYFYHTKMRKEVDTFYREHFSEDLLYKKDVSLLFYNYHPTLLSRPITPNVIEVGGLHVKSPNPLPDVSF